MFFPARHAQQMDVQCVVLLGRGGCWQLSSPPRTVWCGGAKARCFCDGVVVVVLMVMTLVVETLGVMHHDA
jgi:hypothetical protein